MRRISPLDLWIRGPIFGGRLKGKKWVVASGGKILRVFFGTYEREQTALFEKMISEGDVVLDVGAHAGYYSLLASALVGSRGYVFAFEPEPVNFFFLKSHMEINQARNVIATEAAAGDKNSITYFSPGTGTGTGHVASRGPLAVRMLTLDSFTHKNRINPSCIKIDTEGAEMRVLQGAKDTLERAKPVIFLSTHGPQLRQDCLNFLKTFGYRFEPIIGADIQTTTEVLCTCGPL